MNICRCAFRHRCSIIHIPTILEVLCGNTKERSERGGNNKSERNTEVKLCLSFIKTHRFLWLYVCGCVKEMSRGGNQVHNTVWTAGRRLRERTLTDQQRGASAPESIQ